MKLTYYSDGQTSAGELLASVYDIRDDSARLQAVELAFGSANQELEWESDSPLEEGWHVFPYVLDVPYRIPADVTVRDALEAVGVRTLRQVHLLQASGLEHVLKDTAVSSTDQELVLAVCELMRVPGLNGPTAMLLYTTPSISISTVRELGGFEIGHLQLAFEGANKTFDPDYYNADVDPASLLIHRASLLEPPERAPARGPAFVAAVAPSRLAELRKVWSSRAKAPSRTERERLSAGIVSGLYGLGEQLMLAHRDLARRDQAAAVRRYQELFTGVAESYKAVKVAHPDLSLPEFDTAGDLTPLNFLSVCEAWLGWIDLADLALAREEAGLATTTGWGSLNGFGIGHLTLAGRENLLNADTGYLRNESAYVFGRATTQALERELAESTLDALVDPAAVSPSMFRTSVSDARALDFDDDDYAMYHQWVHANSVQVLLGASTLVRPVLEEWSDLSWIPGVGHVVLDVEPSVLAELEALGLSGLKWDDRFSVLDRAGQTIGVRVRDLSDEAVYQDKVLDHLVDAARGQALWLYPEDILDPARFCVLFPALLSVHVPMGLARAYGASQHLSVARSYRMVAAKTGDASALTTAVNKWVSKGTEKDAALYSAGQISLKEALEQASDELREANTLYKTGDYAGATVLYLSVLEIAKNQASTAQFVEDLRDAYDYLIDVTDPSSLMPKLADLMVKEGSVVRPLFTGIVPPRRSQRLVTGAAAVAAGLDSSARIKYYEQKSFVHQEVPEALAESLEGAVVRSLPEELELITLEAETRLRQLEAGLNWLGLDELTVPVWSFKVLLERAESLASLADAWQQRARQLLEASESAHFQDIQLGMRVEEFVAAVDVARANVAVARSQAQQAVLAEEAFDSQRLFQVMSASLGVVASLASVLAAPGPGVYKTLTGGEEYSKEDRKNSLKKAAGNGFQVGATLYSFNTMMVEQGAQSRMLAAQVDTASARVVYAQSEVQMAEMRRDLARHRLERFRGQELNVAALQLLSESFEELANQALGSATRMAWLAERAYLFETRTHTSFIHQAYDSDSVQGRFASAARLLSDIATLGSDRYVKEAEPYQLIKSTVSLLELNPTSLLALRAKGVAVFHLSQKLLDLRHPGLYLHQIRHIEVEFAGSVPSDVHALLHIAPGMRIRVPNSMTYAPVLADLSTDWAYGGAEDADYVMAPIFGPGTTKVVSSFDKLRDMTVLETPAGVLETVEHIAPGGIWVLELPNGANPFDFSGIADVRLTLYFTAKYDGRLADQQAAQLIEPTSEPVNKGHMVWGRDVSGGSRLSFLHGQEGLDHVERRVMEISVREEDLGVRLSERCLENFEVAFVGVDDTRPLVARVASSHYIGGARAETRGGLLYSAYGEESIADPSEVTQGHVSREGDLPAFDTMASTIHDSGPQSAVGRWVVKVLPEALPSDSPWFVRDVDGNAVTQTTSTLLLQAGGQPAVASRSVGWAHAKARALVTLQEGSEVRLSLRHGGAGAVRVSLSWSSGTLQVSMPDVDQVWAESGLDLDANYEVELVVVGSRVTVTLDRLVVFETNVASEVLSGDLAVEAVSGDVTLHEILVSRLTYQGLDTASVIDDTLETLDPNDNTTLLGWTLGAGVSRGSSVRKVLDLSGIDDVALLTWYSLRPWVPEEEGPVVPRPMRAGTNDATDRYLVDASTGSKVVDNGGRYDGALGSLAVVLDSAGADGAPVASGEPVGELYMWDAAQGKAFGQVYGVPGALRGVSEDFVLKYSDTAYRGLAGGFSTTLFPSQDFTWVTQFHTDELTRGQALLAKATDSSQAPGSGTRPTLGLDVWIHNYHNRSVRVIYGDPSGVIADYLGGGNDSSPEKLLEPFQTYWIVVSMVGGTLRAWLFSEGFALQGGSELSGCTADWRGSDYLFGARADRAGQYVAEQRVERWYSSGVKQSTDALDLIDASRGTYDRTGGGTLVHDLHGLRSGVHLEAEDENTGTTLLYADGQGSNPVTAS